MLCARKLIDRLVAEGTLEPVDHSDWAAPVLKCVHLCCDFRMTVNPAQSLQRWRAYSLLWKVGRHSLSWI